MNKRAFTLVEMMIVVIIISGLMFLIVPNITKSKGTIDTKTCDAYITLVESQVQAYYLDKGAYPASLDVLVTEQYIKSKSCPNNQVLELVGDQVQISVTTP